MFVKTFVSFVLCLKNQGIVKKKISSKIKWIRRYVDEEERDMTTNGFGKMDVTYLMMPTHICPFK